MRRRGGRGSNAVAFKNLKDAQNINFNAEVLIHTQMDDLHWNDHCYWFHASYGNSAAIGQNYDWEGCTSYPDGWGCHGYSKLVDAYPT